MSTYQESRDKSNELLNKIREKSEDDFEKQLTFIASGALGISFAFLEKLVDLSKSVHIWSLTLSWVCLALALCINLVSHYVSKNFLEKSTDEYNQYCNNELEYSILTQNIKRRNGAINWANYASIIALFLGLIILVTSVTINISHVSKDKIDTKTLIPGEQRGRNIPVPPSLPERTQQQSNNQPPSTDNSNKSTEK